MTTSIAQSRLVKQGLHWVFGDYQYWKVYCIDLPQPECQLPENATVEVVDSNVLTGVSDIGVRERAEFDGDEAKGFGLYIDGELVAVQWFWWGTRYEAERQGRSWYLKKGEAKSVGLYTVPAYRGKGYAVLLKQYTPHLMSTIGFTRLYSRIWHSHRSSIRVNEKANWRCVGSYLEICPFGHRISLRLPF